MGALTRVQGPPESSGDPTLGAGGKAPAGSDAGSGTRRPEQWRPGYNTRACVCTFHKSPRRKNKQSKFLNGQKA